MILELSEPGFIGFAGLSDFINQDGKSRESQRTIQIPVQTALGIEANN
jgi:hypothetical protein